MDNLTRLYFGIQSDDLEACRREVERLLGVSLHGRVSIHWGEYYSNWPERIDHVELQFNWEDYEDGIKSPNFYRFPLVLSLIDSTAPAAHMASLVASPLLRARRVLDFYDTRELTVSDGSNVVPLRRRC